MRDVWRPTRPWCLLYELMLDALRTHLQASNLRLSTQHSNLKSAFYADPYE